MPSINLITALTGWDWAEIEFWALWFEDWTMSQCGKAWICNNLTSQPLSTKLPRIASYSSFQVPLYALCIHMRIHESNVGGRPVGHWDKLIATQLHSAALACDCYECFTNCKVPQVQDHESLMIRIWYCYMRHTLSGVSLKHCKALRTRGWGVGMLSTFVAAKNLSRAMVARWYSDVSSKSVSFPLMPALQVASE